MNQTALPTPLFQRLRFVFVETSHPGNVGAIARALKTMGFGGAGQMILVKPRFADVLQQEEAIAFASGAQDILQQTQIVETVAEALQGCNFVASVSARLREFSPPISTPRELACHLQQHSDLQAAIIFGNERYGLPNEVVQQSNLLINIPANPDYSSLNLAQAAQVVAYECRLAATDSQTPPSSAKIIPGFQGEAASHAQIEGMFAHLEQALVAIDFLDAENPRKLMPRLKRLFARTQLETEEVNILRGIARQILSTSGKADANEV